LHFFNVNRQHPVVSAAAKFFPNSFAGVQKILANSLQSNHSQDQKGFYVQIFLGHRKIKQKQWQTVVN
jgi:hypothetical protein